MPTGISRLLVQGSSNDDLLVAHPEPSRLVGGEGNDVLIDGPGSDSLLGGGGNNRLFGGLGDDYYTYDVYSGSRDVILDFDPTPGNIDTLIVGESLEEFGPFERYQDDLLIGLHGEAGVITVRDFFLDAAFRIERFRFGATHVTDKDILRNFHLDPDAPTGRTADDPPSYTGERIRLTGKEWADRLVAGDQATYLLGRGGNDLLVGSRYSDVLNGGTVKPMFFGDNHWNLLYGGPGDDYYQVDYSWEFSDHTLYDYDTTPGNADTLHIRGPLEPQYVRFRGSEGGSLYIELDSEQRIVITNYFLDKAFVIEKIRFDDGSVLDEAAIRQRVGLPAPTPPQATMSTPLPYWAGEMPEPAADGVLSLLFSVGAALGHSGG